MCILGLWLRAAVWLKINKKNGFPFLTGFQTLARLAKPVFNIRFPTSFTPEENGLLSELKKTEDTKFSTVFLS